MIFKDLLNANNSEIFTGRKLQPQRQGETSNNSKATALNNYLSHPEVQGDPARCTVLYDPPIHNKPTRSLQQHVVPSDIIHYINDPKFYDRQVWANIVEPDLTAPEACIFLSQ